MKKTAQDIQDDLFRQMTAEQKINFGSKLWRLARDLVGDKIAGNKIIYGRKRSATSSPSHRRNSR